MALGNPNIGYYSIPCLTLFFDAMSGVKKWTTFMHTIAYQCLADAILDIECLASKS